MDSFQELKGLAVALDASAVDDALCGDVALAIHGVPRATQDIDLLSRAAVTLRLQSMAALSTMCLRLGKATISRPDVASVGSGLDRRNM